MTTDGQDVRRRVRSRKLVIGQPTRWSSEAVPPRLSPFVKSRPVPPAGEWRAAKASGMEGNFILLVQIQGQYDNFEAWLIHERDDGKRVIARLEHHGDHPGLHVHDWCGAPGVPPGPPSIQAPNRRPRARRLHRRDTVQWSRETFWLAACKRFSFEIGARQQREFEL